MSEATRQFQSVDEFAAHLQQLRMQRLTRKQATAGAGHKRQTLTPRQRGLILQKTGGRCHICGGPIAADWVADHVLAHAHGGEHTDTNYLPAHPICNRSRWFYDTEEFQWILKLGVFLRTQLEEERDPLALSLAERFVEHQQKNAMRRKVSLCSTGGRPPGPTPPKPSGSNPK